MKILLYELKKIFDFKVVILGIVVFLFLNIVFPGTIRENISLYNQYNTENYPEQIPLDLSKYSVDLKYNDMLLEKYGDTVDADELPLLKEQLEVFARQLKYAVENDEILNYYGMRLNSDFTLYTIYEEEPPLTDEEQQYIWECANGVRKLEGTDYPIYFAQALQSTINYIESLMLNDEIEDKSYHVMSSAVVSGIAENIFMVLWATISSFFIIVPYAVKEKQSNIELFEYSSKTGRAAYRNKLLAIIGSLIITIGIGVCVSLLFFGIWDIQRYYNSPVDSLILVNNGADLNKFYSGFSLIHIYMGLLLGQFICSIAAVLITAIITYRFGNVISGVLTALVLSSIPVFFNFRYVVFALDFQRVTLLTKYEPIFFVASVFFIVLICMLLVVNKKKKSEL